MNSPDKKLLRCAVYTRVSTDYGLDQEFNSLDAQRESSEAYVKSQAHEGWRCLATRYDDGGFSGGSLTRPAMQRLLADVAERRIDVVVVYKVDRLTRSLADFAKLVELFDAHGVSFVSVTQAFNTTNSMGRLTLNVLLSFAQFEREVTGERIRDKVAASKRKGMRMGGPVPLGYDVKDKKLVISQEEAERVRHIFCRYLELRSLTELLRDLRQCQILTKAAQRADGSVRGGICFGKGSLEYLLKNRVYIGETKHKGKYFPGEHPAILDPSLFAQVQELLASKARRLAGVNTQSLLTGRIFDDRGNKMTPATAKKGAARYRYYVSSALVQGRKDQAGSVRRVPAPEIEEAVLRALGNLCGAETGGSDNETGGRPACLEIADSTDGSLKDPDRLLIDRYLAKVLVRPGMLEITARASEDGPPETLKLAWTAPAGRRKRDIIVPEGVDAAAQRPIHSETRARLVEALAKARQWLQQLISGEVRDTREIAVREGASERSVRMTLNLAFVAPDIAKAAIEGHLPYGTGLVQLTELRPEWASQWPLVLAPKTGMSKMSRRSGSESQRDEI
jgi:DNA invertase Pin-like site-specific DNA recombinase